MKEKMNQNIENTLKRIYVAVLRKFREKTGGNFDEEVKKAVAPGEEVCRKIFWESNRDKEEMDLICDWEIISSKAKCEAIEIVMGS